MAVSNGLNPVFGGIVSAAGFSNGGEVITGTTGIGLSLVPAASVANAGVTHKLVNFGDITGNTAFGFGDITKQTAGVMGSFGRTIIATSSFTGVDTGADFRAINKLANDVAYKFQGAYIKAKNYTGGTAGELKGLDLEYANDGTCASVIGLNIRNTGSTAGSHSDIKLSNNAIITTGAGTDDGTIKTDVGTPHAGSIYIANDGKVWVMVTTTWTQLTIS